MQTSPLNHREVAFELLERQMRTRMRPLYQAIKVDRHGGRPCQYCATVMQTHDADGARVPHQSLSQPSRDHMTPRTRGGVDTAGNIVICCKGCNLEKENRTLPEWHVHLVSCGDPRAVHVEKVLRRKPYAMVPPTSARKELQQRRKPRTSPDGRKSP